MAAILSNGNFVTLGIYIGIEEGVAYFGGGAPYGVYGPRTGVLQIVEDELVTEPTLGDFYEPSIALLKPPFGFQSFVQQKMMVGVDRSIIMLGVCRSWSFPLLATLAYIIML